MISDLKYTHREGNCIIKYAPSSGKIYTGGADGEVREFKNMDDDESKSHLIGDETLALAVGKTHFYTSATNTNRVMSYKIEDGSEDCIVIRFTADVTTLDIVEKEGKRLIAAGSDDMIVKVMNLNSHKEFIFKGHEASILSVCLDPKNLDKVVSTSCDGSIILWNIADEKIKKIHNSVLPRFSDFQSSKTLSQVVWNPADGSTFAVAHQNGVYFYNSTNGTEVKNFQMNNSDDKNEYLSVLDWFINGEYIVGGTSSGKIIIWAYKDGSIHYNNTPGRSNGIRSIAWSPSKIEEISFLNKEAYWGILTVDLQEENEDRLEGANEMLNENEMMRVFEENDGDDDDENAFSIKKIKASAGFQEDQEGLDVFDPNISSRGIDEKVGEILMEKNISKAESPAPLSSFDMKLQDTFQPASTPVHLSSRFMVWNSIGIVKAQNLDDESAIDIEFHDTSIHHAFHLPNPHGYTMACLSNLAVVFAAEADGEEEDEDHIASKLNVHYFASSDYNKEWSIDMPKGEEILCICIGSSWIAAGTDKRNLRIFTLAGMQKNVFSLNGPLVTLSGHGDYIFIVTHFGAPLVHNQSLYVAVLDISNYKRHLISHFTPLPLTPSSSLTWAGFSDEGTPTFSDSVGVVRIFDYSSHQWTEVCNISSYCKGKSDSHFMLGLSEKEEIVRAIKCKGTKYPVTVPKPTVTVLPMQLPLCDQGSEKTTLEEKYLKGEILNKNEDDIAATNETIIKLFALAIKSDQERRALEICKLMNMDTLKIAVKYASKLRKLQLANKVNELARQISEKEEERRDKLRLSTLCSQNDMFETQEEEEQEENGHQDSALQDNPLLNAKIKKKNNVPLKCISDTQSQGDTRNPFKKTLLKNTPQAGSIRTGLVFDSISQSSQNSQIKSSQDNLPNKNIVKKSEKQRLITHSSSVRQGNNDINKETQSSYKQLKGFLLWLAENPQDSNNIVKNKELGLKIWKELPKVEKDKYKVPRTPLSIVSTNRKRSLEDHIVRNTDSQKKAKPSTDLSAFAAPE
ncbi:WD repeat and HMG-box DNA-binding protein 1 [Lepeophtheirus salmonis]|uniref:WD repeat and HMG-box DNA-binding protein 1 n=1 Tax=Lepeophtheirus salmonis TaxID=72036 RepID=UPI001AE3B04C|nr:WD repeat and HMG-box DNA-binding protein 1-like isoform X1 [Lepeophtheirus salmonis]